MQKTTSAKCAATNLSAARGKSAGKRASDTKVIKRSRAATHPSLRSRFAPILMSARSFSKLILKIRREVSRNFVSFTEEREVKEREQEEKKGHEREREARIS